MKDKPIIFSKPMILALLAGRKTQTRRLAWRTRLNPGGHIPDGGGGQMDYVEPHEERLGPSPWQKVQPGDRLWVRENFSYSWLVKDDPEARHLMPIWYWADGNPDRGDWSKPKPSIHMPRWASRLTLTVTEVRRQRLQDISEEDAIAEGIRRHESWGGGHHWTADVAEADISHITACWCFAKLWDHLHGAGAWDANPEVIPLTFSVELRNIDTKDPS